MEVSCVFGCDGELFAFVQRVSVVRAKCVMEWIKER
jgi:hypothetical protein